MNQMKFYFTEEEKLQHRLSLSYEERYRAAMRMIRLVYKLKQATIVKPSESNDVNYAEDLKKIIAEEAKKIPINIDWDFFINLNRPLKFYSC